MLNNLFAKAVNGHAYATIISYDVHNNFTDESLIEYLNKTYGCNVVGITGDPEWYGRGTVYGSGLERIPDDWEDRLSESYSELQFIEDEEG